MSSQAIKIMWWNTKLSPPKSKEWNKSTDESKIEVGDVIDHFIDEGYDFIGLCEVSPQDIDFISKKIKIIAKGYDFIVNYSKETYIKIDTCLIYRTDYLLLNHNYEIDGEKRGRIKCYHKFQFINQLFLDNFSIYLSHWPSKLGDNHELRRSISSYIRKDFNEDKKIFKNLKVILMGDYNAEPYDVAMVEGLRSSRDIGRVINDPHLFYNHFWKYLINSDKFEKNGTFFHKPGIYHQWEIFDQILISGSFFKSSWKINQTESKIIDVEKIERKLISQPLSNPSDHNPVIISLEK